MSQQTRFHGFDRADPFSDPTMIHEGLPGEPAVLKNMICFPEFDCLYHEDGSRAPDTCIRRGHNFNIESIGPERVYVQSDIPRCDRPVVYLGTLAWNFWGHFLTEGLSRVWSLRHCNHLSLFRGLFFTRTGDLPWLPHISAFLKHSDIAADRLLHCRSPLILSEVHVPAPTMVNRNHAFSAHPETHAIVSSRICGTTPARTDQPVYLSRTRLPDLHRKIVGEDQLEHVLDRAGVRIAFPEQMVFDEQVRLFNSHKTFIGCIGSGFHSLLFALPGTARTVVLSDREINANYRIVDQLQQLEADYINCLVVDRASRKKDLDRVLDLDVAVHCLRELNIL
jgi:capsular polysaccharide biosynthesis protein